MNDPHTSAATPKSCFNDNRESNLFCDFGPFFFIQDRLIRSFKYRYTDSLHCNFGCHLVPEESDMFSFGADKDDAIILTCFGKIGIFR